MTDANSEGIIHIRGTFDPTDYQVDDVLVCIAEGQGLQKGERYIAQVVTRRRTGDRVVTTLTVSAVSANLRLLEISDAEAFLRRTRFVAEVRSAGNVRLYSFLNAEEFNVWCALNRMRPKQIRNRHYVEAQASPPDRFVAICVPGELDDGSDADWYIYDLLFRTSEKTGFGPQLRSIAIRTARDANRVESEQDGSRS